MDNNYLLGSSESRNYQSLSDAKRKNRNIFLLIKIQTIGNFFMILVGSICMLVALVNMLQTTQCPSLLKITLTFFLTHAVGLAYCYSNVLNLHSRDFNKFRSLNKGLCMGYIFGKAFLFLMVIMNQDSAFETCYFESYQMQLLVIDISLEIFLIFLLHCFNKRIVELIKFRSLNQFMGVKEVF